MLRTATRTAGGAFSRIVAFPDHQDLRAYVAWRLMQFVAESIRGRFVPLTGLLCVIVLCVSGFALLVPGIGQLPVFGHEEASLAQSSRQMHDSGHLLLPEVSHLTPFVGPPLVHWLHVLSAKITQLPDIITTYRLVSLLGAFVCAYFTYRLGADLFSRQTGFLAALGLLAAPLVAVDARQAGAGQFLMAATVCAVFLGWRLWPQNTEVRIRRVAVIPFALAIAFGTLAEGPVLPILTLLAGGMLAVRARSILPIRNIHPITIVAIASLPVMVWILMVIRRVGWASVLELFEQEIFWHWSRIDNGQLILPGFHLLYLPVLLWPLSFLMGQAIVSCWHHRCEARIWLLAWIVPGWCFFEFAAPNSAKITMPLYPLVAVLLASTIETWMPVKHWSRGLLVAGWGLLGLGVPTIAWLARGDAISTSLFNIHSAGSNLWFCLTLAVAILAVGFAVRALLVGKGVLGLVSAVVASAFGSHALFAQSLPSHQGLWVTEAVVAALEAASGRSAASPDGPSLATVGYTNASLLFATNGRVVMAPDSPLEWVQDQGDRWLLDDGSLGELSTDLIVVRTLSGYRYTRGSPVELRLIRPRGDRP